MDMINIICLLALILPLVFGMYLFFTKVALISVNRNILNYGNLAINSILFILFSILRILIFKNNLNFEYNLNNLLINGFDFNLGFLLSKTNIFLILVSTFSFILLSLYSKYYFDKKKHFLFTKRRFYIFLSLTAFNVYLFLVSSNLFQSLIFWLIQGAVIFVFSYFDIYKKTINFNVTRLSGISLIGDISLFLFVLILFKTASVLDLNSSLNIYSLKEFYDKIFLYPNLVELKIAFVCILTAISSKLYIFPFNCYFGFLIASSNILYLFISSLSNLIFGIYLLFIALPFIEKFGYNKYLTILFVVLGLIGLFFIVFERNIKTIFGILISSINAFYIVGVLHFNNAIINTSYIILNFAILALIMKLIYSDKTILNNKLLKNKTGFIVEKTYILLFEKLPQKIYYLFDILDKTIVQNIILFFINSISGFIELFVIKVKTGDKIGYIRIILLVLAMIMIFAIFITLFGSGSLNNELIN